MDPLSLTLGLSWTFASLVTLALAIPLFRGKVRSNALYGARFRQSFQSPDAWYAINRFTGRRLILWCFPLLLLGLTCFFLPLKPHPTLTLILGFAPLLFILIPALQTWRFARRYTPSR